MTISCVFQVRRIWEHSNRGWDGFGFFLKTRIGFEAGSGFVIIYPTPPRPAPDIKMQIYPLYPTKYQKNSTYKYLLPLSFLGFISGNANILFSVLILFFFLFELIFQIKKFSSLDFESLVSNPYSFF